MKYMMKRRRRKKGFQEQRKGKNKESLFNWHRINIGNFLKAVLGIAVVWVTDPHMPTG